MGERDRPIGRAGDHQSGLADAGERLWREVVRAFSAFGS